MYNLWPIRFYSVLESFVCIMVPNCFYCQDNRVHFSYYFAVHRKVRYTVAMCLQQASLGSINLILPTRELVKIMYQKDTQKPFFLRIQSNIWKSVE